MGADGGDDDNEDGLGDVGTQPYRWGKGRNDCEEGRRPVRTCEGSVRECEDAQKGVNLNKWTGRR